MEPTRKTLIDVGVFSGRVSDALIKAGYPTSNLYSLLWEIRENKWATIGQFVVNHIVQMEESDVQTVVDAYMAANPRMVTIPLSDLHALRDRILARKRPQAALFSYHDGINDGVHFSADEVQTFIDLLGQEEAESDEDSDDEDEDDDNEESCSCDICVPSYDDEDEDVDDEDY